MSAICQRVVFSAASPGMETAIIYQRASRQHISPNDASLTNLNALHDLGCQTLDQLLVDTDNQSAWPSSIWMIEPLV